MLWFGFANLSLEVFESLISFGYAQSAQALDLLFRIIVGKALESRSSGEID